ncbi:MAG: choice-of-anchor Q domain-containing protein [Dehalococcoidia bacterium]
MPTGLTFVRAVALTALVGAVAFVLTYPGSPFGPGSVSAATITVTTDTDAVLDGVDGQCGLREAITNANNDTAIHTDCVAGAGEDTIVFQAGITMITLIADLPAISDSDGVTIDGDGAVTISGANMYRPFITNSSSVGLTLQNLTITQAAGSAIINNGALEVTDSDVTNSNGDDGGGIVNFDSGTATITGSFLNGNSALTGSGGAILNEGMMTIIDSTVSGNHAGVNGGAISNSTAFALTITGTTVSDGGADMDGGGIHNQLGTLTLTNSTVSGNMATSNGGGIWNNDELTLNNSDVNGMNTAQFGGGIYNHSSGDVSLLNGSSANDNVGLTNGGGIISSGTLTVLDSSVNDNITANYGGGINSGGPTTITNSTVSGNTAATQRGGGLHHQSETLTITNSIFSGNAADTQGAGIANVSGADATITNTTISGNHALGMGGGIHNSDAAAIAIVDSTLSNNIADDGGGGIHNDGGTLTILRSTLNDNSASGGGGLRVDGGTNVIANSTLSHNTASFGGGLYNGENAMTTLTNVTVTANLASMLGGGIYGPQDVSNTVNLQNTIVADQNTNTDCDGLGFVSLGNNLDSSDTCNLDQLTDKPQVDVFLSPLADNGGPTKTHALLANSAAIDGGNDAACAAAPISGVDQRGESRLQGAHCDIGAYEHAAATPTPSPSETPMTTATATASPSGGPSITTTSSPELSVTATPVGVTRIWGDDNCSGEADPVDSLITLRFDAGLITNTGECPAMGEVVEVANASPHPWGDVDCSGGVDPVDSLKLLRFDAGLPVTPVAGCPELGADVIVS